ncbi:hypothetical protein [Cellulomonas fengjieae]|uniref:Uncharacterized protein n=1 Tax=Cellulomonas fengjieae TaxID=2819978 RepID=A0ABS3SGW5_9CELL|nr:hypothetical protein [Cellulomonas fengjieae]MBO3084574.1 hypothetical protein [Cellulomonas fengjieae]MBO3103346.1 hypothetical protein [Cellulomonas fengjieae]QVI67093.1 hypothetical protein KG102_05800 [Cellulomonas fengjieae]
MNPTISLELARQDHSERLAHSRQTRTRAQPRADRRHAENTGRPPDPTRATAHPPTLVDALDAR